MNQLQNLLHDSLISTSHCEKCALINRDDYTVKAASVGHQMSQQDVEALIDAFDNLTMAREKGIYFNEINYCCLRSDDDSIYAREKDGSKGLVMVQTEKCILMGTYSENMFPSICVEAIEKLADYFRQKKL